MAVRDEGMVPRRERQAVVAAAVGWRAARRTGPGRIPARRPERARVVRRWRWPKGQRPDLRRGGRGTLRERQVGARATLERRSDRLRFEPDGGSAAAARQ